MNNNTIKSFFNLNESGGKVIYVSSQRGSGKSYMIVNKLLSNEEYLRYQFDDIILIHRAYDKDIEYRKINLNQEHIFTDFSIERLEIIYGWLMDKWNKNHNYKSLIIMEDCLLSLMEMRSKTKNNIFNDIVANGRGYGISMLITSQSFKGTSTVFRNNIDYFISFQIFNNTEYDNIKDTVCPRDISPKSFDKLWNDTFLKHEKYNTICFRRNNNEVIIYKNFEKINSNKYIDKFIDNE